MARRRKPLFSRTRTDARPGYVYIAVNDHLPDLVKIGRSADPSRRMVELSGASGVPGAFVIADTVRVVDMHATETGLHRQFAPHRVRGSEFFRIGVREARKALHGAARRTAWRLLVHDALTGGLWRMLAAGLVTALVAFAATRPAETPAALAGLLAALLCAGALGPGRRPVRHPLRRRWTRGEVLALCVGATIGAGVFVLERAPAGFGPPGFGLPALGLPLFDPAQISLPRRG